jgi:hypothetical protein
MAETSLKPLKAILETIRERADYALKQLQASEEQRSNAMEMCELRLYLCHPSGRGCAGLFSH